MRPAFLLALLAATASAQPPAHPSAHWSKHALRILRVQHFPPEKDAKPFPFSPSTSVFGSHKLDGVDCWVFTFTPSFLPKEKHPRFADRLRLFPDKASGWLVKSMLMDKGRIEQRIRKVGEASFHADLPSLPFVFLPYGKGNATFSAGKDTLVLTESIIGELLVLSARFTEDGKERWRTEQRWKPGEAWRRESDLWIDGRLDCSVTAITGTPALIHYPLTHAYTADARLNVPVAVPPGDPTVADLLAAVQAKTGVTLKADAKLLPVRADLKDITGEATGWKLLDACRRPLQVPGWRKEGDGWLLFGHPPVDRTVPLGRVDHGVLTIDPKLQARFGVYEDDPPLTKILALLAKSTGLEFDLAPGIARHAPQFGGVRMRDAHGWMVMSLLATTDLKGGYWEKTATGYRLCAEESLRLAPLPPTDNSHTWASAAAVAVVLGFIALFWWRFRPSPKPAS
ncbi:MAG: hypothetical protein K2W96_03120 [Gemmataceae bacterium]|nr:hypothetical protein [Gemmataceae bacterium]